MPVLSATSADVAAAKDELSRLYWFIHVRLRQNHSSQGDWNLLGYLNGRAEATIEYSGPDAAREEFKRMRAMAERWSDHPEYQHVAEPLG